MSAPHVAVVGLGFLGRGIAACLLGRGYRVTGYARTASSLAEAEAAVARAIDELVEYGGGDPSLRDEWRSRYSGTTSFADLADATFVIESVVEDAAAKDAVYDEVEQVVAAETPIASNTSAIPISALQRDRKRPERFLGMHWAEPAHATRFLELIRGEQTSDAAFTRAVDLAWRCGKEPSIVNVDVPGFVVNRLGYAMYREALHLMAAGVADAETIDRSFRNAVGLWATLCGPLRWIDLTGGPELYAKAMAPVLPTLNNDDATPAALQKLADEGARGVANGRGFYEYGPAEARQWEDRLRRHAWEIKRLVDRERPVEPPA